MQKRQLEFVCSKKISDSKSKQGCSNGRSKSMKLKCLLISILREYYWEYETKCLLIWVFGDHFLLGVALRVYIIVPSQTHFSTFTSIAFFSSQRTCHNLKCKATALNSWDLTLVVCISLNMVHQNIYLWQFQGQKIISRIFALYNNLEISCCMHIVLPQEKSWTWSLW